MQLRVEKDTGGDQFGGIATMVETVTQGLDDRGIRNQVYAADDDHPGTPRIEILVTKWGEGNADLRESGRAVGALGGFVGAALQAAGEGDYEVLVSIYRDGDTTPTCVHKHAGRVNPDDADATARTGSTVGSAILGEALRETADCSVAPGATNHVGR